MTVTCIKSIVDLMEEVDFFENISLGVLIRKRREIHQNSAYTIVIWTNLYCWVQTVLAEISCSSVARKKEYNDITCYLKLN